MEINHKTIYIKIPEPGDSDLEARVFDEENSYGETYKFRNGSWSKENYYAQIPGDINVGFNSTRFRDTILKKRLKPSHMVSGETPNVFRYRFNNKYVDLEHVSEGIYRIKSFGK